MRLPARVQAAGTGILRTGLSGAYLLVKAQHFFERAALAAMAVQQVAVRGYGTTPSSDEVHEAGNSCPICQVGRDRPACLPVLLPFASACAFLDGWPCAILLWLLAHVVSASGNMLLAWMQRVRESRRSSVPTPLSRSPTCSIGGTRHNGLPMLRTSHPLLTQPAHPPSAVVMCRTRSATQCGCRAATSSGEGSKRARGGKGGSWQWVRQAGKRAGAACPAVQE